MACKAEEDYTWERCSLSKQSSRTVASRWMNRPSCRDDTEIELLSIDEFDPQERARLLQAIDEGIEDFERGDHMDGFDFIAQMRSRREAANRLRGRSNRQTSKIEAWWFKHRMAAPTLFTDELERTTDTIES